MTTLTIQGPGYRPVPLGPDKPLLVVGSSPDADVCVTDPSVAHQHGLVTLEGTWWHYHDLGSPGGTYRGHDRVTELPLHPGLVLHLGAPDGPPLLVGDTSVAVIGPGMGSDTPDTVAIPVAAQPDASGPDSGQPADTAAKPRRRRGAAITITLLVIALLGAAGFGAWAYYTARQWQDTATATQTALAASDAELQATTQERDDLTADLASTQKKLKTTSGQLKTARDRIKDLATEKSQVLDEKAFAEQVAAQAGTVAAQLDSCVDGMSELMSWLSTVSIYDEAEFYSYADDVYSYCQDAKTQNDALQGLLG